MAGVEVWGDVATWVAGVGTTAAVGVSLYATRREHGARVKQEQRAQASLVAAWVGGASDYSGAPEGAPDVFTISNGSVLPVYEVILTMVLVSGAGPRRGPEVPLDSDRRAVLATVPPGRGFVEIPYTGWRGMHAYPGVEIAFTDARGFSWVRRGSGLLEQLPSSPATHYGLGTPMSFSAFRPETP